MFGSAYQALDAVPAGGRKMYTDKVPCTRASHNSSFHPLFLPFSADKLAAVLRLLDLISDYTVSLLTDRALTSEMADSLCLKLSRVVRVCGKG